MEYHYQVYSEYIHHIILEEQGLIIYKLILNDPKKCY